MKQYTVFSEAMQCDNGPGNMITAQSVKVITLKQQIIKSDGKFQI